MKKYIFWILLSLLGLLLLFLIYVIVGALIPFIKQPSVSQSTVDSFHVEDYYSDTIGPDRAALVEDNEEALLLRMQMIAHAKERIILSTFDFRSDEAGMDMLAVLLDAANRGVSVEVFVDGFNSIINMEGNEYFYALSSLPNVTIRIYNQINPLKPWNMLGRMHDKYIIVDSEAYLLGGRNTFGFFLGAYEGHKNYDRDVLVYNTGSPDSSLYEVSDYYKAITSLDICHVFHNQPSLAKRSSVQKAAAELTERCENLKEQYPGIFTEPCDYEAITYETNTIHLVSNPTHRYAKEPVVFYQLMELAANAKNEVRIHTPYVICNDAMYDAFSQLGDTAFLMFNSSANNGNLFAAVDYLRHKQEMIDTGVHILEYEGGISYHGKSMTIDDELAIVGSFNMDMRSVYIDTELMLVIHSPEITSQLKASMDRYEEHAALVQDLNTYSYIPEGMEMKEISTTKKRFEKLLGWFLERIRFVL